jgi:hypothetical protein
MIAVLESGRQPGRIRVYSGVIWCTTELGTSVDHLRTFDIRWLQTREDSSKNHQLSSMQESLPQQGRGSVREREVSSPLSNRIKSELQAFLPISVAPEVVLLNLERPLLHSFPNHASANQLAPFSNEYQTLHCYPQTLAYSP